MAMIDRHIGRRQFLQRAAAITAAAGTPFAANLATIAAASAGTGGYKALVCIYLSGGNDQSNTVVPLTSAEYAAYVSSRPGVNLPTNVLLPISPAGHGSNSFGLNPGLSSLKPLFDAGSLAILANVGTLAAPINKAQWANGSPTVPVPKQLFSHADQTGAWQTGVPDAPSATGWLGRVGDLTAGAYNSGAQVSIVMSVAGNATILAGDQVIQYQLSTDGAVPIYGLSWLYGYQQAGDAMRAVMTAQRSRLLESEFIKVTTRSIDTQAIVANAIANVGPGATFPDTWTGAQLAMVARMIAAHAALGQGRQIFFVQQGGYDFHDGLLTDQPARFQELGDAMAAFQAANVANGVAANVTSFTASDFGRALVPNNDGSDHGWGSHHFIMGGAVKGGQIYGTFPQVAAGGIEDAGQGRLIPTTAVDQYAATLATWFGVPSGSLSTVLPNIGRFPTANLGFLG